MSYKPPTGLTPVTIDGTPYRIKPICGTEITPLVHRFIALAGPTGVKFLAEASKDSGGAKADPSGEAMAATMRARVLEAVKKNPDMIDSIGLQIVTSFGSREGAAFVRDACRYAIRNDHENLADDAQYDESFNGNPYEPLFCAYHVIRVNGFFSGLVGMLAGFASRAAGPS